MTEEKLWQTWDKYIKQRKLSISPITEKFLKEGGDGSKGLAGQRSHNYLNYDPVIVKELDGENHELAVRMLFVISHMLKKAIHSYNWKNDIPICFKIGYTFDELVKEIIKDHSLFNTGSGSSHFQVAEILQNLFPMEAEAYADQLLQKELENPKQTVKCETHLDELILTRKHDNTIYLSLNIAANFLLQDNEKYNRYILPIEEVGKKIKDDSIIVLLYKTSPCSDNLENILKEHMQNNDLAARTLVYQCEKKGDLVDFYREKGLSATPYHIFLIERHDFEVNSSYFNKLYHENHNEFMETFEKIAKKTLHETELLALVSIMIKNGEEYTKEKKEIVQKIILKNASINKIRRHAIKEILNISKDFLLKENISVEEWKKNLEGWDLTYYGKNHIYNDCVLMYENEAMAKRFVLLYLFAARDYSNQGWGFLSNRFIVNRKTWIGKNEEESIRLLLQEGIEKNDIFSMCISEYFNQGYDCINFLIRENEQEAIDFLQTAQKKSVNSTLRWIDVLYDNYGLTNYTPLIDLVSNKSKMVRKRCEAILNVHEDDVREELEKKQPKAKGEEALLIRRLIRLWDNERKFGKNFSFTDYSILVEFCKDNYNIDNKNQINWIPENMLTGVHYADLSGIAPTSVLNYLLVEYMSLESPYRIRPCDKVVECLNETDLQNTLENIYQLWKSNGAEAKKKMIMVPYCIYGSDIQIIKLRKQLEEWTDNYRGALAAFVVGMIALNGRDTALMMVDGIATKFPNKQVKREAGESFARVAEILGVPEDELSDRIIPTLGFSKEGEKTIDYGTRSFTVTLAGDFSLSIFDESKNKAVKTLPKPNANDDAVKSDAAKKEFGELKKQIKAIVQNQTARLEKVMMNGRIWNTERWSQLFVENAIMHRFATGLVWGRYQDGKLMDTFRYMEDGTFNTVDEEEYELPQNAAISLAHPCEMGEELTNQWVIQLEDYEVVQPLAQLMIEVCKFKEADISNKIVKRYDGKSTIAGKITSAAKKYNMIRGEIWDAGSYSCYHLQDSYLGVGVQICFEYMHIGQEFGEAIPLEDMTFYTLPKEEGTFISDDIKPNLICDPQILSPRFVSSVIEIFDKIIE